MEGSPFASTKLEVGKIIKSINGTECSGLTSADAVTILKEAGPGDVTIEILQSTKYRDGISEATATSTAALGTMELGAPLCCLGC